jgi:elongation of very long chain fatty acids protein 6
MAVLQPSHPQQAAMSVFTNEPFIRWAHNAPWAPSLTIVVYALAVMCAPEPSAMPNVPELRRVLIVWNIGMAIFSAWCAAVAVPHFLYGPQGVWSKGLVASVCSDAAWFGAGSPGLVTLTFTLSKFIELGDTVFLALRKRTLTHLHTFHHAMTLALTWSLFERRASTGFVFIAMNAFIHAIMYTYYAAVLFPSLRSVLVPNSHWITVMQITQMIIGVLVNLIAATEIISGRLCRVPPTCVAAAGVLYTIYMVLFVQFAVDRKRKSA